MSEKTVVICKCEVTTGPLVTVFNGDMESAAAQIGLLHDEILRLRANRERRLMTIKPIDIALFTVTSLASAPNSQLSGEWRAKCQDAVDRRASSEECLELCREMRQLPLSDISSFCVRLCEAAISAVSDTE